MASALQWVPDTLYNMSLSHSVTFVRNNNSLIKQLPKDILFDIYYRLYKQGKLCLLGMEMSELRVFEKILQVNGKRHLLHHCFQALVDHGSGISKALADHYSQYCCILHCAPVEQKKRAINLGISLGTFLCDAGWYGDSDLVFAACLQLCKTIPNSDLYVRIKALDCCIRCCFGKFSEAVSAFEESQVLTNEIQEQGLRINLAGLYAEYCFLHFVQSKFDEAYGFASKALKLLNKNLPARTIVDVLRQAARICVVKRKFHGAELLIKHAVKLAMDKFGSNHPKTASVLSDYGFYLLNVDCVGQSVQVYQTALNIRQSVFGGCNLLLSTSHEDLAYACYVNEYNFGIFTDAREHIEKAMELMKQLLPSDHLLLASTSRVKALILEEIALEIENKDECQKLLEDAHELHLSALHLTRSAFGDMNKARKMHLSAIAIKETLLGTEDYEVALSIGHLASLYAYDMHLYDDAEKLYLRSISVGVKLFGEAYSGLEYDYRGLLRVYSSLNIPDKIQNYRNILDNWKRLRDERAGAVESPLLNMPVNLSTEDLIKEFFEIC
ncbi:Amyloid protein-binding protein 2 [Nymphon striatum]|nr:Amyloid protein-binding protein 2 [Nymphon striatum]